MESNSLHWHRFPFQAQVNYLLIFIFSLFLLLTAPAFAGLGASVTLVNGQSSSIYPTQSQSTQLLITLSNSNTQIDNVNFSSVLPGSLLNGLVISGPVSSTCNGLDGALTAIPGSQSITLTDGTIPAQVGNLNGSCNITIPVTATSTIYNPTTYFYTIAEGAVTGVDSTGAVENLGFVGQSINVLGMSSPTMSKSFSDSNVILGGTTSANLTININNPNSIAMSNVGFIDQFPTIGLPAVPLISPAASGSSITCTAGGTTGTLTNTNLSGISSGVQISGMTVPANGSCSVKIPIQAYTTNSVYQTSNLTNTVPLTGSFTSDFPGLNPNPATASIRTQSPLSITKSVANSLVVTGISDSFKLTFKNNGVSPLTINSFADDPIDGLGTGALTISSPISTTCNGTFAQTSTGITQTRSTTLNGSASCTVTIPFTGHTPSPKSYTNSVPSSVVNASIAAGDKKAVGQPASASVTVANVLVINKAVASSSPAPGNPVQYTVNVQNWSNTALNNVAITDPLPGGQTFLTGLINNTDYTPTLSAGCGGNLTVNSSTPTQPVLTIPSVPGSSGSPPYGSCSVSFWAMIPPGTTSSFANTLGPGTVCSNDLISGQTCNSSGTSTPSTNIKSVIQGTKSFNPAGPLVENTPTTMKITVLNNSLSPLNPMTINDTLPTGMVIAATPNFSTTCSASCPAGSGAQCINSGSNSVTLNGATVPAGTLSGTTFTPGICQMTVDVNGVAGSYSNTATIAGNIINAAGTSQAESTKASASLIYNPALSGTKTFSPTGVGSGGLSKATVQLANASNLPITNASLTDPLPSGMTIASPSNASNTCGGTISNTANSITMQGATIPANGNCSLSFNVIATGTSNWVNTIPKGNVTGTTNGNNISNLSAITRTLNYLVANLTVAKATNPSGLNAPGAISTLTVTVNNGSRAVSNLNLTDYFTLDGTAAGALNGMEVAPIPNTSTTCNGATVNATPNSTSVSLSGGSLAANSSCQFSVDVTSVAAQGITNTIPVGAVSTAEAFSNSNKAQTSLAMLAAIGISKHFTPNLVAPNVPSTLRISLLNSNSQTVKSMKVTDLLPTGVSVAPNPHVSTTCLGNSATILPITCSGDGICTNAGGNQITIAGAMLPGAVGAAATSCYIDVDVVAPLGTYTNTIPVGALTATVGSLNTPAANLAPTSDILYVRQPIGVNKAFNNYTLDASNPAGFTTGTAPALTLGQPATLTITLTNPNPVALSSVGFTDAPLSASSEILVASGSTTNTCGGTLIAAPSSSSVSLSGGTLPAEKTCTITVPVSSSVSGSFTDTIGQSAVTAIDTSTSQPLNLNNTNSTSAMLVVGAPLVINKAFNNYTLDTGNPAGFTTGSPSAVGLGMPVTLSITLINPNSAPLNGLALSDILPADVLVGNGTTSNTCGGSLTAVPASNTLALSGGTLAKNASCTLTVPVYSNSAGTYTNKIAASSVTTTEGITNTASTQANFTVFAGSISGKVFVDYNDDGLFNGPDYGLGNQTIILSGLDNQGNPLPASVVTSVQTAADGSYSFTNLPAGTYTVTQIPPQPAGTLPGITSSTSGTASNPNSSTVLSQISAIPLTFASPASVDNNFAEIFSGDNIVITKTTPLVNVEVGQLVPYMISVHNKSNLNITHTDIRDTLPPEFTYKPGTASLDGSPLEPIVQANQLVWANQTLAAGSTKIFKLMLIVGAGAKPGLHTNSVQVFDDLDNSPLSNIATAIVRVIANGVFNCTDIIGKVFDDKNGNGSQDSCEFGIANVRLATVNGLLVTTDAQGRFHIPCAAIPQSDRGRNFLIKLDERTLPTGYRLTTENPRDVRLTPGKMVKANFGARICKIIHIDVSNSAFIKDSSVLKDKWLNQLNALPQRLKRGSYTLKITYTKCVNETQMLVQKRLAVISDKLKQLLKDVPQDLIIVNDGDAQ